MFKKALIIAFAALLMPALLILAALIPKTKIKENSRISAQYLYDGELFGYVEEGVQGSRIDRYADAILLNIAYNYDSDSPVKSVMMSEYYFTPDHQENENFLISVKEDPGPNRQYLRYWHGSLTLVRPLLTIMSIRGIYVLNGVALAVLLAFFCAICARIREYKLIIAMATALVLTRSWYVPLSLEYTWTFMVMLISSIIAVILYKRNNRDGYVVFFAITGIATSFVDFLTTETLTLLVPLLILLWLERGRYVKKDVVKNELIYAVSWGLGYSLMWVSKWILCSAVIRQNALPYVTEHVAERLGGDIGISTGQYIVGAVINNIACLFPLGYGAVGVIGFILILLFALYRGYVYRQGTADNTFIMIAAIIAVIPYVRYMILHNHSFIHCFFTYRAQAATIMAVTLIIASLTEKKDNG